MKNQVKTKYRIFKNILTIIESGDIKDERYRLLIRTLKIEDVEYMRKYVNQAEYDAEINEKLRKELFSTVN